MGLANRIHRGGKPPATSMEGLSVAPLFPRERLNLNPECWRKAETEGLRLNSD